MCAPFNPPPVNSLLTLELPNTWLVVFCGEPQIQWLVGSGA